MTDVTGVAIRFPCRGRRPRRPGERAIRESPLRQRKNRVRFAPKAAPSEAAPRGTRGDHLYRLAAFAFCWPASRRPAKSAAAEIPCRLYLPPAAAARNPTIATGHVQCPTIAMTSPVLLHRPIALAPFSSGPGADHLLFGKTKRRWGARRPPLPGADTGGRRAPQPRPWRAVAKQAREGHSRQGGSHYAGIVLQTGSGERIVDPSVSRGSTAPLSGEP